jgi:hypothetical protein
MATHLTPHHIVHWARGGETTLLNLVMICPFHHHLIHEGGWSVILDGKQLPLFFRPSGRVYDPGVPVDDVDRELAELLEQERRRDPDPDSIEARFGVRNFELQALANDQNDQLYEVAKSLAGY